MWILKQCRKWNNKSRKQCSKKQDKNKHANAINDGIDYSPVPYTIVLLIGV